jgi:hypothetical protein
VRAASAGAVHWHGALFQRAGGSGRSRAPSGGALHDGVFRRRDRLRADEPRQGAPAGACRAALCRRRSRPRRATRVARAVARRRYRVRPRRRRCGARRVARSAAGARRRSAPAPARNRRVVADGPARSNAAVGGDGRLRAANGARTRPRRPARFGPDVSGLCELGRPAQLACDDGVQPAVEPVLPHGQGSPVGLHRIFMERRRASIPDERCRRATGARQSPAEGARTGEIPRLSQAIGAVRGRRDACLGRIFSARARDAAKPACEEARASIRA